MAVDIDFDGELELEDLDDAPFRPAEGKEDLSVPNDQSRYTGPERRKGHRRSGGDRRGEVRFEDKDDRRSGKDRRKGTWDPKYRI